MPELPEVETFARYFARHALNRRIARVGVRDDRILDGIRSEKFAQKLRGRQFLEVRRHGKHLFADAGAVWLHLHFGMTGDLAFYREGEPRFSRVVFDFADGSHLAFEDMRLFGLAGLLDSPDAFVAGSGLGPDPLARSFRAADFLQRMAGRRGAIKSLFMSQEFVAGLGNLYVDELLYQTGIHPRRAVSRIGEGQRLELFRAMRRLLRDAIARHERGVDLPPRSLFHHREVGERCPHCAGTIRRTVVFGRTTYFCAKHQK